MTRAHNVAAVLVPFMNRVNGFGIYRIHRPNQNDQIVLLLTNLYEWCSSIDGLFQLNVDLLKRVTELNCNSIHTSDKNINCIHSFASLGFWLMIKLHIILAQRKLIWYRRRWWGIFELFSGLLLLLLLVQNSHFRFEIICVCAKCSHQKHFPLKCSESASVVQVSLAQCGSFLSIHQQKNQLNVYESARMNAWLIKTAWKCGSRNFLTQKRHRKMLLR